MSITPRRRPPSALPERLEAALCVLVEAYQVAKELKRDVWDFAVRLVDLRALGLTDNELRYWICKGWAQQALEVFPGRKHHRIFRDTGALTVSDQSCVVLTAAGAAVLDRQMALDAQSSRPLSLPRDAAGLLNEVPHWDQARRELRIGPYLVKRINQPASCQILVLAAFDKQGWPRRITDPLPDHPGQEPKQRLHDAIVNLNRHQRHRLLRFHGDGTGRGVCWELWLDGQAGASPEPHQRFTSAGGGPRGS